MSKKYFWLKLKDDFFRSKEMKKLRSIAGGDTFTIIYLKMQLLSIKHDGIIRYESIEDNFAEELALELDEQEENVRLTLMFLEKHGLLEQIDEERYLMPKVFIGSEVDSAERVRRHRDIKKALHCNAQVTISNTEIEKEIDIEIDKEIEQQSAATVYSIYQSEIGILSSLIHERLDYWLNEFDESIVIHAIKLAAESNVRRWAYIDSILKAWSDRSVKTLDDVLALQAAHKRKQHKPTIAKPKIEVAESTTTVSDDEYQELLKKYGLG